jgi:putative redox protein
MADDTLRSVEVERIGLHLFRAINSKGHTLTFSSGEGDGDYFTPIEMFLAAIGGCTALDVEYITGKRAEPDSFTFTVSGDKIRDDGGNRMINLEVILRPRFPDGPEGDAAREVLPSAVHRSHDRLCTVSRTVEHGTPVKVRVE